MPYTAVGFFAGCRRPGLIAPADLLLLAGAPSRLVLPVVEGRVSLAVTADGCYHNELCSTDMRHD